MQSSTALKGASVSALAEAYERVRRFSEYLCEPLETEDYVIQSMPDVSPTKWHLAHVSWYFETFVLSADPAYQPCHPQYNYLFNSYYNAVGPQWTRGRRGVLSRPTVEDVYAYRRHVDAHMARFFEELDEEDSRGLGALTELGLNHEQQHQELLLMDIKHVFACNPLRPVYRERTGDGSSMIAPMEWIDAASGPHEIGHAGERFAYDNEGPRHEVLLRPFQLRSRPVTCGEYQAFMEAGGYRRPEFWLSDGWSTVQAEGWAAPLYWERMDGKWHMMTLSGFRPVAENEPVCHVSYYEADAYATWAGARLPTEAEWEVASHQASDEGNFAEDGHYHPVVSDGDASEKHLAQMLGDVWEWTSSPYSPYPGYRPAAGAVGEYNGKFMCNQFVLRGGSCVTSKAHIRRTYRNFFGPHCRWAFSGIRLARDA